MAEGVEIILDGAEEHEPPAWRPPSVERVIPLHGTTHVHGYTGADVAQWKHIASLIAKAVPTAKGKDGQPTPDCLRVAQCIVVCRRAPGSAAHTFNVSFGGEAQAWRLLGERGPGSWVEQACRDSNALTMEGYYPQREAEGPTKPLSDLLTDPAFWTSLNHLSLSLYGVRLAENDAPLPEVLAALQHDAEVRGGLLQALAPLAALAR